MKKSNHLALAIFFVLISVIAILMKYYGAQYLKYTLIPILLIVIVLTAKHLLKTINWNDYDFMEHQRNINLQFGDEVDYFEEQEEEEEEIK